MAWQESRTQLSTYQQHHLYVCVCVCVYVCMYVYMHIFVYIYVYIPTNSGVGGFLFLCTLSSIYYLWIV